MPLGTLISEKLGRCPRCMGLSLGLSTAAWGLLALAFVAGAGPVIAALLLVPAVALSALFLAHVFTFAVRAIRTDAPCRTCGGERQRHLREIPRRQILGLFGSAVIAAAALSVSNAPGVRLALAARKGDCGDIGGPLKLFDRVCVTAEEPEEQLKQRLLKEAQEWITANQAGFEKTARDNCALQSCKNADQPCIAVHYRVSASVNCFDDRQCRSGRSCEAAVSMGVNCRCVNRECGSSKLTPPVEISAESCMDNPKPTKKELEEGACKKACEDAVSLAQKAADRVCDQEACAGAQKCKVSKVDQTKPVPVRVKDKPNCCRCSITINSVQCQCQDP